MADNVQGGNSSGPGLVRTKDRSGVETQIVLLDMGGSGAESLLTAGQQLAAASLPVVLPAAQITTLTPPAAITNFAIETGGNLAAVKADLDTLAGAVSAAVGQVNVKQMNGVATSMGNGTTDTGTQRVSLSSDSTGAVKPGGLTITGTGTNNGDTPIAATDITGYPNIGLYLNGGTLTCNFEGSNDNSTWFAVNLLNTTTSYTSAQANPSNSRWEGVCAFHYFRVRVSGASSGTVTAQAFFSSGARSQFSPLLTTGSLTTANYPGNSDNGSAASNTGIAVGALGMALNGAGNSDRLRNNTDLQLLATGAKTTAQQSADQINFNGRGVRVVLNVTVASGTGGLQVQIQGKDSISGNYYQLNATPAAVTTTGTFVYDLYAGNLSAAANGITQVTMALLSRTWRVNVAVGDASSYTYSVSAITLL
jgi:hypothetical protein